MQINQSNSIFVIFFRLFQAYVCYGIRTGRITDYDKETVGFDIIQMYSDVCIYALNIKIRHDTSPEVGKTSLY